MLLSAIIAIAVFSFVKANQEKQLSELALVNIEALASGEYADNEYYCYGEGDVRCPYSGKFVAGYIKKRILK